MVTVLYGTEYGFAREISEKLHSLLDKNDKYWYAGLHNQCSRMSCCSKNAGHDMHLMAPINAISSCLKREPQSLRFEEAQSLSHAFMLATANKIVLSRMSPIIVP